MPREIRKQDFRRINEYLWELPTTFDSRMNVPVRIYADEELLEDALGDLSVHQAVNVASLPGLVGYVVVMPDVHQGYGMPVGGVMASRVPTGIISPGAVGYDINCGVRLLATDLTQEQIAPHLAELATRIYYNCPSGVGSEGHVPLTMKQLDEVLAEGARWALRHGYARPEDLEHTEEFGCMPNADPDKATPKAKERGKDQLGTLGAGNHFIEVDVVEEIFDPAGAERMGLFEGQVAVQIHCGSRGFGHQICTDYLQRFERVIHKYGIKLPDKELMCAPIDSPEGQDYLQAMACAANFAFCNRQILAHYIRKSFEEVLRPKGIAHDVWQVYDIAHNMGKIETHEIDGQRMTVCVHRKGATRAWGPGSPGLPKKYTDIGQPVLIPGSMGTASYVLLGTPGSMAQTFGSTCHGAGRVMSRAQAKREIRGEKLKAELEGQGIVVRAGSMAGLAEEAPKAYKDVSRVVEVVHHAGIAKKVARLRPIAVIKG
ncbi:RtcB family protein [Thermoflexus sp.]|uniref:RtcB family protein n=1 Tax=Thermoflexus sp. TaxID=1969742 RepID=UPI002ADE4A0F|nr:RtcB family protein [Thermoflexus sp.]